ncbi:hypothetical protein [Actinacidiphila oryziradicis]|uniref:hypothetical protein n=1 Tax=Actinacidiphila oryziradicis TaxID=2571141 RepID=UPI00145EAD52|nr:hypothetical protein [Actinacidiphila oryziradicis]
MGSVRRLPPAAASAVAATATAVLIALGGTAGPAAAAAAGAGGEPVTVKPTQIRPGGDLEIRTRSCGTARTGTVISTAFVTEVALAPAADGGLHGSAVVGSGTRAGTYPVSISCNGNPRAAEGKLTVMEREQGQQAAGQPQGAGPQQDPGQPQGAAPQQDPGQPQAAGPQQDPGQPQAAGPQQDPGQPQGAGPQQDPGQPLANGPQQDPGQPAVKGQPQDPGQQQSGQQPGGGVGFGFQTPVAPVHAGGGGTAPLAAEDGATSDSARVPGLVAAGVLIMAGVAGLMLHRRRGGSQD